MQLTPHTIPRMKRLLGLLMLAALLGVGPGAWLQIHQSTCCARLPAAGDTVAFHRALPHSTNSCPICFALHAPIATEAATTVLNLHSLLESAAPQIARATDHSHPIAIDCRGPPALM